MPKTYYDSELTAEQIEDALTAIYGVVIPGNNGKVLYIEDGKIKAASASRWSGGAVLEPLSVAANGDYTPPTGTDGFNSVHVAVPGGGSAAVQPLSVTENGIYNPPSGVDGFTPVTVNVQGSTSNNDLLFHFADFKNSGKMQCAFYNQAGYLISNEQSKFGETSLKIDSGASTSGAVYFDAGFTFGNQDFTLDFWMYQTSQSTYAGSAVLSFSYRSLGYYSKTGKIRGITIASSPSSWSVDHASSNETLDILGSWHHVAITRNNNIIRVFVDGSIEDEIEWNYAFAPMTRLSFGTNSTDGRLWRGYIDEFRLKIGEAVWTENFTPPTQPYV